MKPIAVTGANGQLGSRLVERLGARALPLTRSELDLERLDSAALDALEVGAIINAAAYTNVEKAEEEPERAYRINTQAPGIMAEWAAGCGIPFLHISTDYVFDGNKGRPYVESDETQALNAYGASKAKGEEAVLHANPDACIMRVSWLYDAHGRNFFTTIGDKLKSEGTLRVVADQKGTPCYAPDIADAILALLEKGCPKGIYHLVQQGDTSWYGFASAIREAMLPYFPGLAAVEPIVTDAYPTRAKRPVDSRLDASLLYTTCGIRLPEWQDAVKRAVKERYAH